MKRSVKKLYNEALENKEFNMDFKLSDSTYYKPNFFTDEIRKILYTSVYEGYLIAKGQFDEANYK